MDFKLFTTALATLWLMAQPSTLWASGSTVELRSGWSMCSAKDLAENGKTISTATFMPSKWHPIKAMPATVLKVLEDDGTYPNLYFGMNLAKNVPRDLFRQDWWYRTTFTIPATGKVYWLDFKGINYRAEVWLNGERLADSSSVVGMYCEYEFNVTGKVKAGTENVLAVKVTPEQKLQDLENSVELADSWCDWIDWNQIGIPPKDKDKDMGISFVPDRNAGIWKKVILRTTDAVEITVPCVTSDLPLPATSPASLRVYCDLKNGTASHVSGMLRGEITRPGKPTLKFEQLARLSPNEKRELSFSPEIYQQLLVGNPDLWWPYQMGDPNLYHLKLSFFVGDTLSDVREIDFGIRKITKHHDTDFQFTQLGTGGNLYLKVNGKDFLVRGACYTPDLLYGCDENREDAVLRYVKDMGLNFLRWEAKISSEHIIQEADRAGIPLMFGWMCCNQWEKWPQWNGEDHLVARRSLRSQIQMMRAHPSVILWANGSDGLPPENVRDAYHSVLWELHWLDSNVSVDTVSSFATDPVSNAITWDGVHMEGPYTWRPPAFWFSDRYLTPRGSCAEQGDNEHIPPLESLKKFLPNDKLWPINEHWSFHSGANTNNNTLKSIRKALDFRYGPSGSVAEFAEKAQLAHYENTRAQFEGFAAGGWSNHKMTVYWMLNSHWPSFFGHLFDFYLKPGGAYYGAKKGLQPLSLVYDGYATGDRTRAHVFITNQRARALQGGSATVQFINIDGTVSFTKKASNLDVKPLSAMKVMEFPRLQGLTQVFFVRCVLKDVKGRKVADNVYWQSQKDDDMGPIENDDKFELKQVSWADLTPLNTMSPADVLIAGQTRESKGWVETTVTLKNRSRVPAFFMRTEIVKGAQGDEILPILWDDNYITLFAGESTTLRARYKTSDAVGATPYIRLAGHNVSQQIVPLQR